ncbi:MAG: aminotransferase class III-fold pyridoxal phosphate-dependent enzyme [Deltaproteobacteria bacterium]|nr:aminotransferase class III-fold pyridoxal phosphate-dependent enzyme [Deltaproteobacteria bacterium]
MAYKFDKSMETFARAAKVIPQGIYGHLTPAITVPGLYPYFVERAKGSHFWDVDGNEYIDYMCAYGPMILGYAHDKVDEAFVKQAKKGTCVTIASPLMVKLAERLVEINDCADWAIFAKNGADTTSMAILLARAYNRRKKIVLAEGGYHGTQPWCTSNMAGVTPEDRKNVLFIPWGDLGAFRRVVEENKDEIAGVMLTPYHHPTFADQVLPEPGYWSGMREICDRNDIVLIVDDVRAGWRLDIKGSAHYFGFRPDLACYCKAIANGYSISALVGTEKMRIAASKIFATGSYWFNSPEMAAALACIDEMEKIDVPSIVKERGLSLTNGLKELATSHGLKVTISGPPAIPFMTFSNENNFMRSQLFCAECAKMGVFFNPHHNWFMSAAHTEEDIKKTLDKADKAFKEVKKHFGD